MADYPVYDGDGNEIITESNPSHADLSNAPLKRSAIDTDVTLAANSDDVIPSQKAIKAYIAAHSGSSDKVVYKATGVSFSTNAQKTLLGTTPVGKRFIQTNLTLVIDATTGTFTPGGSEITILCGTEAGSLADVYFGFYNSNVHAAGRNAVYGGNAVATGSANVPASTDIKIQFNNAGITGGGTATGTVILEGYLIDA